jgi:pantoate--beta-alanine ligase
MIVVSQLFELKELIFSNKNKGKTVGFCPTMGFLHKGHLSLVQDCKIECDIAVVSIYVNPSQFNEQSDFDAYPKDLAGDIAQLEAVNCDVLWLPTQETIESIPLDLNYELNGLDLPMEGRHRPGHFKGVIEVVYRLFQAVKPHKAFFGEKDFQQFSIIQKMVENNNLPVKVIPKATVRESDGLAMSSRNVRLNATQRLIAPLLIKELQLVKSRGEVLPENIKNISQAGFELEYLEIQSLINNQKRVFVAAKIGNVRLIDNIAI